MSDAVLYQSKNNASGQLDSGIGAAELSIPLGAGEGAEFPQPVTASATSGGTGTVLNSTGIQAALAASGIVVGAYIKNITDGSYAFIRSISTNSITTTTLRGGSDNTWQNNDVWRANEFIITLNSKDANGVITDFELARISDRSTDILTVPTGGRGFGGTAADIWDADDFVELFVVSEHNVELIKLLGDNEDKLEAKADLSAVNALLAGRNWKEACRAATTVNGTLATAYENGDIIDGITLATGDRILIKNQTAQAENGIYTVNASGAPTRATDFDEDDEVAMAVVFIEEGTVQADTMWICTNDDPVDLGTDNIIFSQFTSGADAIPKTIFTTKGSLITASAAATPQEMLAGLNTRVPITDDQEANGLRFGYPQQFVMDEGWQIFEVGAGTKVYGGLTSLRLQTASSANNRVNISSSLPGTNGTTDVTQQYDELTDGDILEFIIRLHITTTPNVSMAVGFPTSTDVTGAKNSTNAKAIFKFDGTTLESSTADGTTEEDQTVSGITLTNWNTFKVRIDLGNNVKFYVNDVLKTTHSTNVPADTDANGVNVGAGVETIVSGAKIMYIDPVIQLFRPRDA